MGVSRGRTSPNSSNVTPLPTTLLSRYFPITAPLAHPALDRRSVSQFCKSDIHLEIIYSYGKYGCSKMRFQVSSTSLECEDRIFVFPPFFIMHSIGYLNL